MGRGALSRSCCRGARCRCHTLSRPCWGSFSTLPVRRPSRRPCCGQPSVLTARRCRLCAGLSLLKRFMRERGPYDFRKTVSAACATAGERTLTAASAGAVRPQMFVHNAFLCVLSAVMFAAVTWEAGKLLVNEGFAAVWNDPTWRLPRSPISLWCYVFYVSKYYELLDTVFILLKKREPDIVQLWHHTVVLLLFWSYMESRMMNHWWLVWANAFVHIFVYGYFAAATLKIDVWFKKYITILQISQFVFDMAYSLPFPVLKSYGNTRGDWEPWYFGQFIGATFIVLFTRIYFRISAAQARKAAAAKAAKQKGEGAESRGNGNAEQRATTPARQRGASPAPGLKRRAARSK